MENRTVIVDNPSAAVNGKVIGMDEARGIRFVRRERPHATEPARPVGKLIPYPFPDHTGAMVFRECRIYKRDGDKNVWYERPPRPDQPLKDKDGKPVLDGDGQPVYESDWVKGLAGVEARPLYNRDAIAKAPDGATVFIVEGPPKVEALRKLGLLATCNPGGAASWHKVDERELLKGKRIVILPDNNKSGREFAQAVALSLRDLAASVQIPELPGLRAGEDVVDWLRAGHTRTELDNLVAAAACVAWEDKPQTSSDKEPTGNDNLDMVIEALRAAGCDPTTSDPDERQWDAYCPAHEDNKKSLRVAAGTDKPVVMWCNTGCKHTAVVKALDLEPSILSVPLAELLERTESRTDGDKPLPDADPAAVLYDGPHEVKPDDDGLATLEGLAPLPVLWLWQDWLPYGALTLMDGDPGLSKSTVTLDLAARVSQGRAMPFRDAAEPPAQVLLATLEDDLQRTVVPRLLAAGAYMGKILAVPATYENLTKAVKIMDVAALVKKHEASIVKRGIKLMVLDPLFGYLPDGADPNREAVRKVCLQLAALAQRTGIAIIGIRHLNKGEGQALYRGSGNISILGTARAGWLVAADPEDGERCILAASKCNLGPKPKSISRKTCRARWGRGADNYATTQEPRHMADSKSIPVSIRMPKQLLASLRLARRESARRDVPVS
jgi:hypothetical protein